MGQFSYEEQGTYTWLLYQMDEEEQLDNLSIGMLTKNKIPGILPVVYTPVNDTAYIRYNVSSKVNAKKYLTGVVSKERILNVFYGITSAMLSAESYMLDAGSIVLDLNYIFIDVSSGEASMLCVPIFKNEQKNIDFSGFFRNILFTVQFDPTDNFDYVTKLVNYLNSTSLFSMMDFKNLVANLRNISQVNTSCADYVDNKGLPSAGNVSTKRITTIMKSSDNEDKSYNRVNIEKHNSQKKNSFESMEIPGGNNIDIPGSFNLAAENAELVNAGKDVGKKSGGLFGGLFSKKGEKEKKEKVKDSKNKKSKDVLHDGMEIPILEQSIPNEQSEYRIEVVPCTVDEGLGTKYEETADDFDVPSETKLSLYYISEGGSIPVNQFPFEIGREGSGFKIELSKSKVSRKHAVITKAGGEYLITDYSKHGTFLNGERIPYGEPRILKNGMRILLKTEEFEVRII